MLLGLSKKRDTISKAGLSLIFKIHSNLHTREERSVNILAAGTTTTTPVTTNSPTTTNPSTTTPTTTTTTTPYTTTPSTGVLGGVGSVGPSGAGSNTDFSHGGLRLEGSAFLSFFMLLSVSGLTLLWD